MGKLKRLLKRLNSAERKIIGKILQQIESGDLTDLDVKRLKGRKDVFRVRKGKLRIIFYKTEDEFYLVSIERRTDTTYK